jgi:uncharacterized protein (DUF1800 family)
MSRRVAVVMLGIAVLGPATVRSSPPSFAVSETAAAAAHVLNRLAFGPRPGDIDRVQRMGLHAWIDEQLHPERIDDRALAARIAGFRTLPLDTATILRDYYQPAVEERRARRRQAGSSPVEPPENSDLSASRLQDPRIARPQALSVAARNARLVVTELSDPRILRAVYSERQLEEVLTDFWFNHFNVFAGKGPTGAFLTSFERDAIRPYVLGNFRQMLEAVAQSPAMLFYLDNWQNVQPQTSRSRQARAPHGINENFARELLELHTLGVDAGYTQDDIVNVARAFTGWTMRPRQDARFEFAPTLHDRNEKRVLGHTLKGGRGVEDGRDVLDILVAHPSTARFIATKLARKFVSDTPPAALIERAARRFGETRGDLREVTRTILTSPELLAPEIYRAKVKTPLEFVASALRATGAQVHDATPIARVLRDLGMPLYFCQPPAGYDEAADTWISSGALVARMNFALELGNERLPGLSVSGSRPTVDSLRTTLVGTALPGDVSEGTRAILARAATPEQVVALVIGSPEFQRQ